MKVLSEASGTVSNNLTLTPIYILLEFAVSVTLTYS